jgi:hypothetical protein
VLANSVTVAIAEGPSIPAAGSSVSFSGTAAVARNVDADPSFQDPEQVVRAICAHFFSALRPRPRPTRSEGILKSSGYADSQTEKAVR